ncbi:tyrosine-protein phosphatase [Rhizobium oryzicola]|uniref:Tyrosine-protein phosphatase n=1 Tax=Rhizobium oryzicola TaxID=1232668 RepID=A0ABT8SXI9_9HYPH|nr:tyrosine-protein phosphatase [Rhizobium oryzicola]MDO1583135.1 tyrosine-protein phosphatase [Rhizobium oryzicola]
MNETYSRLIELEGAHNVRDLGGYPIAAGGCTRWRSLLRGDALHALTPGDIAVLTGLGLAAVIDLRNPAEVALEPNPFAEHDQVGYLTIPLFSALSPVEMMAQGRATFDMGERYCHALDHCQEAIALVLSTIAQMPAGAVLFHCSAGKDRTGLIAALLLGNAGVPPSTIIEDYALTGLVAEHLISKLRARALARGMDSRLIDIVLASEPTSMQHALNHLTNHYGNVVNYLRHIGLKSSELKALDERVAGN